MTTSRRAFWKHVPIPLAAISLATLGIASMAGMSSSVSQVEPPALSTKAIVVAQHSCPNGRC
jgi:hypothetical protein